VVADVSGKGVGSALLASLLQGALITATGVPEGLVRRIVRLNQFLLDRTGGEKYATLFYKPAPRRRPLQLRERRAMPADRPAASPANASNWKPLECPSV